jgi:hypothetical protein
MSERALHPRILDVKQYEGIKLRKKEGPEHNQLERKEIRIQSLNTGLGSPVFM